MTPTEAHALVAYAISICSGEPDWLACSLTPTGPIVVAVPGSKPTDCDYVTDHVADAVNWLVEQDRITPERAAAEWLQHLVRAGRKWEDAIEAGWHGEDPNDRVDELIAVGSKMAELVRIMAETFGLELPPEDDPTAQEKFPFVPVVEDRHRGPGGECPHCGKTECRCHEDVGR